MKGKLIGKISLLVVFIIQQSCFQANSQPYYFMHYEVESGLSNNAVICSIQDKVGFMWFGTRDGLNRFDGYNFKVYRFSDNNFVHALNIDPSGNLFVATEKDIFEYDPISDSFKLIISPRIFPINQLVIDVYHNVWFTASHTLFKYSTETGKITTFTSQKFFAANSLGIDKRGFVWVGTDNGYLERYNPVLDSFTGFDVFSHSKSLYKQLTYILCTDDNRIVIGTFKGGFKIFDISAISYKDLHICPEKTESIIARSLLQVSATEIWIGTETGIYVYNPLLNSSITIRKQSGDPYAISDNVIYSLCKDREGGIWVGTYFRGINYYPKQFSQFIKYYQNASTSPLSGNIVRELDGDSLGNLWIGMEDGGISRLNVKTGNVKYFKAGNTAYGVSYSDIHNVMVHGKELWVAVFEHGLNILEIPSGKILRHYDQSSRKGITTDFVFSFNKTKGGDVLVGTENGAYSYNKNRNFFEPLPGFQPGGLYLDILKASDGTIWASVFKKGISYFNPKTRKSGTFSFDRSGFGSTASNKVNKIFEDSKKRLWFGTENGLCTFDPITNICNRYTTKNGLPSNFILAMLEDDLGKLWISTTKGLACFDPNKMNVTVYNTANGLLSDQFNFSSAFKDISGRMFFGCAKGLVSFDPRTFVQDSFVPPVYITTLQINNEDVSVNIAGSPLKRSITYTDKIILTNNQSTFSLDFAALGYTAPQNLVYSYCLEGASNNRRYTGKARRVNFTNLIPGTYVFKVKASSSAGIWNDDEKRLTIVILPPWWKSVAAYCLYVFLIVSGIYILFRHCLNRIERKNKIKIELLEISKERELLESKIDFFTHVAHEIRTPVTLIKIPLAKIIRTTSGIPEIEKSLRIIDGNADRLIQLSNQLLDFRQTELKAYRLNLEETDIAEIVKVACNDFSMMAEQSGTTITSVLPDMPVLAHVDIDAFKKIVYNLFSNAVKYSTGNVEVVLKHPGSNPFLFVILFKNDGFLIPPNLKEKIFEPFFRVIKTNSKMGTGIGLALSRSLAEMHGGTLILDAPELGANVFNLTLPIRKI